MPSTEEGKRGWPGVRVFCLPRLNPSIHKIQLGQKGPLEHIEASFAFLPKGPANTGYKLEAFA